MVNPKRNRFPPSNSIHIFLMQIFFFLAKVRRLKTTTTTTTKHSCKLLVKMKKVIGILLPARGWCARLRLRSNVFSAPYLCALRTILFGRVVVYIISSLSKKKPSHAKMICANQTILQPLLSIPKLNIGKGSSAAIKKQTLIESYLSMFRLGAVAK